MKGQAVMTKSQGPGIMDMPTERVAPRRTTARTSDLLPAPGARAPGRTPVASYLEQNQLAIVQALLARLRGERGVRVTMQEALFEALQAWCDKHGVKLT
jgi:hypothetical protein